MHKLILIARALSSGDGIGICTVKDADSVNVGAISLEALGAVDGAIGNLILESIETRRRAIGEEDNDLLGVGTTTIRRKFLISQL